MKKFLLLLLFGSSLSLLAQEKIPVTEQDYRNSSIEMADAMRADGKIYVVVAVLVTVLAGMIIYTIRIDGRISRLEKEIKNKEDNTKSHA